MKNKKELFLLSIFSILILASVFSVMGATTLTSPVTGTNYSSTMIVTITVDSAGAGMNMTNVSCYYNATGGVATNYLVYIANTTKNQLVFTNTSVPISSLTDAITYNISCRVSNGSTLNTTVSATSVGIYSDSPSCSMSLDRDYTNPNSPVGVVATDTSTVDALGTKLLTWYLYNDDGTLETTSSTSPDTFSDTDFEQKGNSILGLVISDSLGNNATCTNKTIFVKDSDGTDTIIISDSQNNIQDDNRNKKLMILLGLIVIIFIFLMIVALAFVLNKKGKRR